MVFVDFKQARSDRRSRRRLPPGDVQRLHLRAAARGRYAGRVTPLSDARLLAVPVVPEPEAEQSVWWPLAVAVLVGAALALAVAVGAEAVAWPP